MFCHIFCRRNLALFTVHCIRSTVVIVIVIETIKSSNKLRFIYVQNKQFLLNVAYAMILYTRIEILVWPLKVTQDHKQWYQQPIATSCCYWSDGFQRRKSKGPSQSCKLLIHDQVTVSRQRYRMQFNNGNNLCIECHYVCKLVTTSLSFWYKLVYIRGYYTLALRPTFLVLALKTTFLALALS